VKVKELIALLEQCDPEAQVLAEGCDCTRHPDGVYLYKGAVVLSESGDHKPGDTIAQA
jgi:hypothetical protein